MRLVFADEDFVYAGRPRPRFPLILGDDMNPLQPFHSFLIWRLLEDGRALDILTWENYGSYIWDFVRFLHANDWVWDQHFSAVGQSALRTYRDWQSVDLRLNQKTINHRVRLVQDFYCWALARGLISRLPFNTHDVRVYGTDHELGHVTGGVVTVSKSNLLLDEWEEEPSFLNAEQIRIARSAIRCTEHRLLFDLMARVGLRSVESRTLPKEYAFNVLERPPLRPGCLIDLRLNPREMKTKFSKPRNVHVPFSLMEEMHTYSNFERNRRVAEYSPATLFLTTGGNGYKKGDVHKAMADLGRRVGFPIRPLMLRHSFAIHTLLLIRNNPKIKMEPLLYVRDRLGHASAQTTMIYLSQMERLMTAEAMAMIGEFDNLYGITSSLKSQDNLFAQAD